MGRLYRPSLDRIQDDTDEFPLPPCTKVPDLFTEYRTRKAAQKICTGCPFSRSCVDTALFSRSEDPGGVYGGTTKTQRMKFKRDWDICRPVGVRMVDAGNE